MENWDPVTVQIGKYDFHENIYSYDFNWLNTGVIFLWMKKRVDLTIIIVKFEFHIRSTKTEVFPDQE